MASPRTYVRLKPVNKPKGYHCRRFVYRGVLFRSGEWKLVPGKVAAELGRMIQPRSEDNPKPLFDVGDRSEVERVEAAEKAAQAEADKHVDGAKEVSEDLFRDLEDEQVPEPAPAPPPPPAAKPKGRRRRR